MFEPFLKSYYDRYKYQSIDSNQFKEYFLSYFKDYLSGYVIESIEWDTWFNKPGMPIYKPRYDETLAIACADLSKKWVDWNLESESCPFTLKEFESLSSEQKIEFLAKLLEEAPLSVEKLDKMEQLYNLNANNNSEIKFKWIRLGLKAKWMNAVPRAVQMVTEQGRMKFLRPLYR